MNKGESSRHVFNARRREKGSIFMQAVPFPELLVFFSRLSTFSSFRPLSNVGDFGRPCALPG